jgi:hypothetical protein
MPAFRPNKHSKYWIFNDSHRRQPSHSNRPGKADPIIDTKV